MFLYNMTVNIFILYWNRKRDLMTRNEHYKSNVIQDNVEE
jgi:hypothetical protein